jgi:mono/diheme cytochrome c family protein
MKLRLSHCIVGAACVAAAATAAAQTRATRIDLGKREFDTNCASCHGVDGKGHGALQALLKKSPPDLTQLAKANGGVLPINRLYQTIEGGDVAAHGTRDMPVWGRAYSMDAAEYYVDAPYDQEAYVRSRILLLLEYINRLQVK